MSMRQNMEISREAIDAAKECYLFMIAGGVMPEQQAAGLGPIVQAAIDKVTEQLLRQNDYLRKENLRLSGLASEYAAKFYEADGKLAEALRK